MSVDMTQFHSVFFDESVEHLQTMEELLLNISIESPDPEDLNSIFRAAHSIKGGSGIFGFDALTGLTHVMETILDKARNNELALEHDIVDALLKTCDTLSSILEAYQQESDIDWPGIEAQIKLLQTFLSEEEQAQSKDDGFGFFDDAPQATNNADEEAFGFFDDEDEPTPAKPSVDTIEDDGFGFFDTAPPPVMASNEPGFGFFTDPKPQPEKADDGFGFFDEEDKKVSASAAPTPAPVQASKPTPKVATPSAKTEPAKAKAGGTGKESTSIRVDTVKIDAVVNLVGEMVITQSMLRNIGNEVEGGVGEKLETAIDELSRNIREIQEAVMSMRMLPVSFVFNRFPRLVRDLASKLDKKIDLDIIGGNTEVDKSMIEKLADPLTHLVRNSIDHGIEKADVRLDVGKPETGRVTLKAEQRGSNIVISITDDGGGLNRDKILEKAKSNGLDVSDRMPDNDVWKLIFEPGFSTAEAVTDVSGRGVGMDVVRKNIEAVGGSINIRSTAGVGSVFQINLPLTLAIVDGLCVLAGEETFVIPLLNIVESLQPDESQIKSMKNDQVLWSREQYWPLVDLAESMGLQHNPKPLTESIIVLVEINAKRYGIIVDDLVGEQQVVIKSLERHYRKVQGISGATIMGDGKVAMILDVENLVNQDVSISTE